MTRTFPRLRSIIGQDQPRTDLNDVTEQQTVSDIRPAATIADRLPHDWTASCEVVQSIRNRLEEALIITGPSGLRFTVLPETMLRPTGATRVYLRESPTDGRRFIATFEDIDAAIQYVAYYTSTSTTETTDKPTPTTATATATATASTTSPS